MIGASVRRCNQPRHANWSSRLGWRRCRMFVVFIGNEWRDQVQETGHHAREDDLDRIVRLGIKTLRYPVVWEHISTAPSQVLSTGNGTTSGWLGWRCWACSRSWGCCTTARVRPYTDLLNSTFPTKLAAYAGAVAARYPWVKAWTPVNEPLTTARFSGLYGHWFPHERNLGTFCRMVVNQCLGVLQAMRAIRA